MTEDLDVEAINIAGRMVLLTDGQTIPITTLLDDFNEETDDEDDAAFLVAGPDARGKWWRIECDAFEPHKVH